MSGTDEQLAGAAGKGDRQALRCLLERHHDTAFRFAYRLLGSRADAQDVAQEVLMRVVSHVAAFRGDSRFSTWLYQLVLNACRDHRRRQGRLRDMQQGFAAMSEAHRADWADSEARLRWLYLALDQLKPDLKETALLILAEEVTQDDAATILGISAGTVAWRMSEVKKRLRAMAEHDHERL